MGLCGHLQLRAASVAIDQGTRPAFDRFVFVMEVLVNLFEAGTLPARGHEIAGGMLYPISRR
jgi:hypothetical protein